MEAAGGRLPLAALSQASSDGSTGSEGALAGLSEATLAALASRAGLLVARASLFAAEALTPERAQADAAQEAAAEPLTGAPRISRRAQPRKAVRRTRSSAAWNAPTMFPTELASAEITTPPLAAPQDEHD